MVTVHSTSLEITFGVDSLIQFVKDYNGCFIAQFQVERPIKDAFELAT